MRVGALVVGVAVSLVAAAILVVALDLGHVATAVSRLDAMWLLPAAGVLVLQAALRATRWARLLESAAGRRTTAARVAAPMLVGYMFNAILPGRAGEVVRTVIAARRTDVPVAAVAGSVVAERVVDLVALLGLGAVALAASGSPVGLSLAAIGVALAVILGLAVRLGVAQALLRRLLGARVGGWLADVIDAIGRVRRTVLLVAGALSLAAWLGDAALAWLVARGLSLEVSLPGAIAIGVGGSLGTALPAAPGYLATYELGAASLATAAGVPGDVAVSIAIVVHVVGVVGLALAGAVALGSVTSSMNLRTALRATNAANPDQAVPR